MTFVLCILVLCILLLLVQGLHLITNKEMLSKNYSLFKFVPLTKRLKVELVIILEEKEDLKVIHNQLREQLINLHSFIKFIYLLEKDYQPTKRGCILNKKIELELKGLIEDPQGIQNTRRINNQDQIYDILKEVLRDIRYAIHQLENLEKLHKKLKSIEDLIDLLTFAAQQLSDQKISQSKLEELERCDEDLLNDIYESERPGKMIKKRTVKEHPIIFGKDKSISFDRTKKLYQKGKLSIFKKKESSTQKLKNHKKLKNEYLNKKLIQYLYSQKKQVKQIFILLLLFFSGYFIKLYIIDIFLKHLDHYQVKYRFKSLMKILQILKINMNIMFVVLDHVDQIVIWKLSIIRTCQKLRVYS